MRSIDRINRELSGLDADQLARGISVPDKDREMKQLVEHINALLRRAASSYAEVSEFSSRVAHELRTPLTLLRMRLESGAAQLPADVSEELQEQIARLSRLVERSLTIAKAQGGKLQVSLVEVDLSSLLADLRDGYATLAGERKLSFRWACAEELRVSADPDLMRQILHNLLDNAVRCARSFVALRASRVADGAQVEISISNDNQAPSPTKGTGMGLRLVKALVSGMPRAAYSTKEAGDIYEAVIIIDVV